MAKWEYGKLFDNAQAFLDWLKTIPITSNITATHLHHTWKPSHSDFTGVNHARLQDSMRNYHKGKGWRDIAQHVTVFPDGRIMTGRDINWSPASATGYNGNDKNHPFMIEMVGNFDKGNDVLQGKQLESVLDLCRHFGNAVFHNECLINGQSPKSCPGSGIDKEWFMMKLIEKDDFTGHWAEKEIRQVIKEGKMQGYPDGTFKPDKPLTRAELAHMIAKGVI